MAKQKNERILNTIEEFLETKKCLILDLKRQKINWTTELCKKFGSHLKQNKQLESINFKNTGMTSDSLKILVEGLNNCKYLKILDLSDNNIDDDGAKAIANLIEKTRSKKITLLSLHVNEITDEGSEVLSKAILGYSKNIAPTTMKITLNNNHLTEEGVRTIEKLIGGVCNIVTTPQNELESNSSSSKSPSKTGSLVCSPKKTNPSKEEDRLKAEAQLKADEAAAAEAQLKADKTLTLQKEIMSMVSNRGEPDSTDKKIFRDKLTKYLENGNLLKDDFFKNCIKTLCEKTGFWSFMVKASETTKALARGLSHNDECLEYLGIRNGNDKTIIENITDTLNNYTLLNYDSNYNFLDLDNQYIVTVLSGDIGE